MPKKIVLAYSGGLDTSVILKWLQNKYSCPVVTFTAGGIATPADAALMMQFGMDGVFVGSGIFKSEDPITMAKAVVEATAHFNDAKLVGDVSRNLGESMPGLEESSLETKMAKRGH